jgi:hypothetical protein
LPFYTWATLKVTNSSISNFNNGIAIGITMKKFIKKVVFISVPLLLALIAVNYWGDAAQLFNYQYPKKLASIIYSGKCAVTTANYDERLYQKECAKDCKKPYDLLVIGSSRTLIISFDYFINEKVFNCSVSGASIEDLVAIYQMYKANKMLPKKILFGIDPWFFNKNNAQTRWLPLNNEYRSFFSNGKVIEVNPGKKNNVKIYNYSQLISPSYFQSSIKNIPDFIVNGRPEPKPTDFRYNKSNTRLTDGSLVWGEFMRNATPDEIDRKAQDYLKSEISIVENYDSLSSKVIEILDMLITDCKKNNIDVAFILQPYNPIINGVIEKEHPMIITAEKYVRNYAGINHIKVFGSYDPKYLGFDKSYFYDGSHGKEKAIKKILGTDPWLSGN